MQETETHEVTIEDVEQKLNKMWNIKEKSSVIIVKKYLRITTNLCDI